MAYFEIMKEGNFKGCKYVITRTDDILYAGTVDMWKYLKIISTSSNTMMISTILSVMVD